MGGFASRYLTVFVFLAVLGGAPRGADAVAVAQRRPPPAPVWPEQLTASLQMEWDQEIVYERQDGSGWWNEGDMAIRLSGAVFRKQPDPRGVEILYQTVPSDEQGGSGTLGGSSRAGTLNLTSDGTRIVSTTEWQASAEGAIGAPLSADPFAAEFKVVAGISPKKWNVRLWLGSAFTTSVREKVDWPPYPPRDETRQRGLRWEASTLQGILTRSGRGFRLTVKDLQDFNRDPDSESSGWSRLFVTGRLES